MQATHKNLKVSPLHCTIQDEKEWDITLIAMIMHEFNSDTAVGYVYYQVKDCSDCNDVDICEMSHLLDFCC